MDKDQLWQVYKRAQALRQQGYSMHSVNQEIHKRTDGQVPGLISLEKELGVKQDDSISTKNLMRSAYQGATFGWGDELAGAVAGAIPGGHSAESMRGAMNTNEQAFREEHPVADFAAGAVGGALIPGAGGAGALRAAGGGMARRMLAGGVTGGLLGAMGGAAEGAGRAEPGQRVQGATGGGLAGSVVGGAIGTAAPALGPPARKAAGLVTDRFQGAGANRIARNEVMRGLEDARIKPSRFQEAIDDLPPGSVAADVSPALAERGRTAGNINPDVQRVGGPMDPIIQRNAQTGERMATTLRDHTGLQSGFDIDKVSERAKKEVRDMYFRPLESANQRVWHPELDELWQNPDMKRILRGRGIHPGEDGSISFTELQSALGRLRAKLKNQADPDLFQRYSALRERLLDYAEEVMPDYKAANTAYFHALERGRAWELGQKAMGGSAARLTEAYNKMPTDEAREAFRQGFLDKLERGLREKTSGQPISGRLMSAGPELKQRALLLFDGDEAKLQQYMSTVEAERRWGLTWSRMTGNSTSARQLGGMADSDLMPGRRQLLGEILTMAFDDRATRMAAAEIVTEVLSQEGEDAARRAALLMSQGQRFAGARQAITAVGGGRAAAGLLPAQEESTMRDRGGLLNF